MEDLVFRLANFAVLPFWAAMILAPRWSGTQWLVAQWWMIVVLCVYYMISVVVATLAAGELVVAALSNPTLGSVGALLERPEVTAAAWSHYLAFDLFVGRWMFLREPRRGYWLSPILLATLMLGPSGLFFYLLLRGGEVAPAFRDDFSAT